MRSIATFIRDTRDKIGKHNNVDDYLIGCGHKLIRSKMFKGDVTLLNDQSVCIDLKQDLNEVYGNLTQQHERFSRECAGAQENGIKLIFLVEHGGSIHSVDDVAKWYNPRLNVSPYALNGERISRMMKTYSAKYGVEWRFCRKQDTGKIVESILLGVGDT